MKKPIVFFLIALFVTIPAQAADPFEDLLYVTEEYRPYNYMEDNRLKGLSVELLHLIWQELETPPKKIKLYPWARGYHLLKTKENVVLFTTAKTEERAPMFKWVCPITTGSKTVLIALKKRRLKIESLEDARRYRIGVIRQDAAEQILIAKGFNTRQLEPVATFSQNIQKLDAGRIDLISFHEESFFHKLKNHGFTREDYEILFPVSDIVACYAFNRGIPDPVVQRFQSALDTIHQRDDYRRLLIHYFPAIQEHQ